ncbi:hypothetical protein B0T14DRAFT_507311 [Immersiella caudata]|uniref:Zn(2)-C6 fungal-type domain-containing protein n=1 Tax=Immersiella caudata TaxID=314043 RepID=A0AA40CCX4_9PEZI|nr:hypothetical protein B0T14DRAFT_507311 [Immersiella caudata]
MDAEMASLPAAAPDAQMVQQQHSQHPQQLSPPLPAQNGQPAAIKRRSPIACRRCRRMRSKCVHEKGKSPCQACAEAGIGANECIFPVRGQPDHDRDYRHPRMRSEKSNKRDPASARRDILDAPVARSPTAPLPGPQRPPKGTDEWDLLPPLHEVIDSVNRFTRHYFQLGFIHKPSFPERLRTNHRSVSVFLLLSLLSVSARLTPSLVERYGGTVGAAEVFMERASHLALSELYKVPTLERCQAFYLLSISQQGSGLKYQSSINFGIAVKIATILRLHREETYKLSNPIPEAIIELESARRTLWMLHSQDNLHSGPNAPISLSAGDITTLLPSNEADFAYTRIPLTRAALEDTPPAKINPDLVRLKDKSLFATLIQSHYYWGAISRRAVHNEKCANPWDETSEYATVKKRLMEWENDLPGDHRWSKVLLKGHKQDGQDLAYLGVTMVTRLCNIVIRKAYLYEMVNYDRSDPIYVKCFKPMARELFDNVENLYEQIETQYNDRTGEEGMGGQMAAFIIYSCGFLAAYLCKYKIDASRSVISRARAIVGHILTILGESKDIWPLASRWHTHLEEFYKSRNGMSKEAEGSMADSKDPIPHILHHPPHTQAPVKPPSPEGESNANSQSPNGNMHGTSQQPTTPALYIDPNLRLPPPPPAQSQSVQSPVQQQQPMPPHMQTAQAAQAQAQAQQAMNARRPPDNLSLLIEAFDTQTAGGALGTPTGQQPGQQPYDPQVPPQNYYHPSSLGPDGYETQLAYYLEDSVPSTVPVPAGMPNWAIANGLSIPAPGMYYQ